MSFPATIASNGSGGHPASSSPPIANSGRAKSSRDRFGLGRTAESEWPEAVKPEGMPAIDWLKPRSDAHALVLPYLQERIQASALAMTDFYARWRYNERRYSAYVNLPDWEERLRQQNEDGRPARAVRMHIPYSFFTINTINTYLFHVFSARRPIFPVGSHKPEYMNAANGMEILLQYNADHSKYLRELNHMIHDSQVYGVGIMRTRWTDKYRMVTKITNIEQAGPFGPILTPHKYRTEALVYSGNESAVIDPFKFFPDPNVPMTRVNRDGEFIFWNVSIGRHILRSMEVDGEVKYIDAVGDGRSASQFHGYSNSEESDRSIRSGGNAHAGLDSRSFAFNISTSNVSIDEGSIKIIPRELGLGESTRPEMWIFTIANGSQIIRAEPSNLDHGMHPVVVTEPYGQGHSFGALGISDFIGDIGDLQNWLLNSHVDNNRKIMNDMIVYNPDMIEEQDLKQQGPGKRIRLKPAAFGQDVKNAIYQLPLQDVTRGHISDLSLVMGLGERVSAVSENLLGIQDSGGRKTATEVRTASNAGTSRLAFLAKIISAEAITDMTQQWSINNQQFLDHEFQLQVLGAHALSNPITIGPAHIAGDFHYPVHDGTVPFDKIALFDLWNQLFAIVVQTPELRLSYNVPKIFENIAEIGGATNIESLRTNAVPDAEIQKLVAAGIAGNLQDMNQITNALRPGDGNNPLSTLPQGVQNTNTGQVNAAPVPEQFAGQF